MRLVMSDVEFQKIELQAILRNPESVPVPPVVLEQVVPIVVVLEPQPVMDELVMPEDGLLIDVPEAEDDIEPTFLAPIVVPKTDDSDKDEDPEMDPKEID